jgi:hypothetical protein
MTYKALFDLGMQYSVTCCSLLDIPAKHGTALHNRSLGAGRNRPLDILCPTSCRPPGNQRGATCHPIIPKGPLSTVISDLLSFSCPNGLNEGIAAGRGLHCLGLARGWWLMLVPVQEQPGTVAAPAEYRGEFLFHESPSTCFILVGLTTYRTRQETP